MQTQIQNLYNQLTDISFWISLIEGFKHLGPLAPIFLAFIESVVPALPLIVIISFNVTAYGPYLGFIYSWLGTYLGSMCMFSFYRFLIKPHLDKFLASRQHISKMMRAVSNDQGAIAFTLTLLPFTPSSLINLVYGLSDFSKRKYWGVLFISKAIMVTFMTFFGHSLNQITSNPLYLLISVILLITLYFISKKINKRFFHN